MDWLHKVFLSLHPSFVAIMVLCSLFALDSAYRWQPRNLFFFCWCLHSIWGRGRGSLITSGGPKNGDEKDHEKDHCQHNIKRNGSHNDKANRIYCTWSLCVARGCRPCHIVYLDKGNKRTKAGRTIATKATRTHTHTARTQISAVALKDAQTCTPCATIAKMLEGEGKQMHDQIHGHPHALTQHKKLACHWFLCSA